MHRIPDKDTILKINFCNNKIREIPKEIELFTSLQ